MNWTKAINGKMKNVMRNLQGCTINYCQYYLLAVTGERADYTVSQKKQDTKLLAITSPTIIRFSKCFH